MVGGACWPANGVLECRLSAPLSNSERMALVRADRAPSPHPQPWSHLERPCSKLVPSLSASSLATAASRSEESSPYLIRNLSSGEVVDLREECSPGFADTFAQVTDSLRRIEQVRAQWY